MMLRQQGISFIVSEQFFSVVHSLPINVEPLPEGFELPSLAEMEQELPEPFRIAGAITHIDLSAARQLRNMGEEFGLLVDVINQQSSKINMLLGYLLSQLDDPATRRHTLSIGGSQLSFIAHTGLHLYQLLRLKLFLQDEASAIYCYGQITALEPVPDGQRVEVSYVRIRPADQELLVRASLHIQSRQLKQRAELRAQQHS